MDEHILKCTSTVYKLTVFMYVYNVSAITLVNSVEFMNDQGTDDEHNY